MSMQGKKHSEKSKIKMRLSHLGQISWMKGKHHSEETKEKMRIARARYEFLPEVYKKVFESRKNNGKEWHSEETKKKIGIAHKGEKNWNWKGDKAGYVALHQFIAKNKPKPILCENCKKEKALTLANIKDHHYTRNPDDYRWLCYKCHSDLDFPKRKKKTKYIIRLHKSLNILFLYL